MRKFYKLKIRGDLIKGKKSNQRKLTLTTSKAEVTVEAQRKQSSWPINNKGRNIFSQMWFLTLESPRVDSGISGIEPGGRSFMRRESLTQMINSFKRNMLSGHTFAFCPASHWMKAFVILRILLLQEIKRMDSSGLRSKYASATKTTQFRVLGFYLNIY